MKAKKKYYLIFICFISIAKYFNNNFFKQQL